MLQAKNKNWTNFSINNKDFKDKYVAETIN